MCRNIKRLANFHPPATHDEIQASALQYVRKLSGTPKPSQANQAAFNRAVSAITAASETLLANLVSTSPPRNRKIEAQKARQRNQARFGQSSDATD